ncbi:MAG: GWxTD domain-containing protein [Candidatus Krumholzibacteriota bacterium]|nr:GWxTD domain-containing protein [Candidatus Krumholzibacteriota bacterium]
MTRLTVLRFAGAALACALAARPAAGQGFIERFSGETELAGRLDHDERWSYAGLRIVMNGQQRRAYLSIATRQERRDWLDRFWIDLDPTPATDRNERRTEHERRVVEARKRFPAQREPGWDRRGEIFIRYGEPDEIVETESQIGALDNRMPGEVWYFHRYGFLVSFQDEMLTGEYTCFLETSETWRYLLTPGTVGDFFRDAGEGVYMHPFSARQTLEILEGQRREDDVNYVFPALLPQHVDPGMSAAAALNPDMLDFVAGRELRRMHHETMALQGPWEMEKAEKMAQNFYAVVARKPFIHDCEFASLPLGAFFDAVSFRGGPGLTRTELLFAVPASRVLFVRSPEGWRGEVAVRLLVRDKHLVEVRRESAVVFAEATADRPEPPVWLPGSLVLTLEPGRYRFGLEACDANSDRRSDCRMNVVVPDFEGDLALSDILFASSIRETGDPVAYQRGNLQVVPHPVRTYLKPFPLVFYVEIYHLDVDGEGIAFYDVEFTVEPTAKRRWGPVLVDDGVVVSSSFRTSGYGADQVQRLEIATETLPKGVFRLGVRVTDRRTLAVARQTACFTVIE